MDFAIIQTGGKQYKVSPGQKLKIEKIAGDAGKEIIFDHVLLSSRDGNVAIGMPRVEGAKVTGTILRHARDRKKTIFKYHSKARVRRRQGHRQHFTEVKITAV